MYTSEKRLLLSDRGEVVEEGDPKAVKLLVAEGGTLSDEEAAKYGLSGDGKSEDDKSRPKEIKMGKGEPSTAEMITDEEEINLGKASDETPTPKKASKKASKKSK